MSFLTPLYLAGALAIGLPILFHLIRRVTRKRVPFSSLMLLRASPPRMQRRKKLDHLLLLALRCAIIVLLAAAFARPFFVDPAEAREYDQTGRRVVVLIDTSASMRRTGQWDAAVDQARTVIRQLTPNDQAAVFAFDRHVDRLVDFEEWNSIPLPQRADVAVDRIRSRNPTWSVTDLAAALVAAADAIEDAESDSENALPFAQRRIELISDMQSGARLEALQTYEWPEGVELKIHQIGGKKPTNAGIQLVNVSDDLADDQSRTRPKVRITNAADSQREQFKIQWVGRDGVMAGDAKAVDVYAPPGQSRVVQAPATPAGFAGTHLRLVGDDHDFDNDLYLAPHLTEQINILYLGSDDPTDVTRPLYYLERAFQQTATHVPRIIVRDAAAGIRAEEFNFVKLLVLADVAPPDQAAGIRRYVESGGTALVVMDTPETAATIASIFESPPLRTSEADVPDYAMLGRVDLTHPLFAPFADPRFGDFTRIHFWSYRRIAVEQIPGARVLAAYDNDDAAWIAAPINKGHLLITTSSWRPQDSQLALSSKFVPLMYSLLEFAGGITVRQAQFFVGDQVPVSAEMTSSDSSAAPPLVEVRAPGGRTSHVEAGAGRFSATDEPGLYTMLVDGGEHRFAVNLDAAESRTDPLPLEHLEQMGIVLAADETTAAAAVQRQEKQKRLVEQTDSENRQKMWRWLILAAVMIAMLEMLLAGRFTRIAAQSTGADS